LQYLDDLLVGPGVHTVVLVAPRLGLLDELEEQRGVPLRVLAADLRASPFHVGHYKGDTELELVRPRSLGPHPGEMYVTKLKRQNRIECTVLPVDRRGTLRLDGHRGPRPIRHELVERPLQRGGTRIDVPRCL